MRILLAVFCLLSSISLFSTTIKGKVINDASKKPIEFADVILYAGEKSVANETLNEHGEFHLKNIKNGDYILQIRLIGFETHISKPFSISKSKSTHDFGTIEFKEIGIGLEGVEVVYQKKHVIYKLDKKVINASANVLAGGGTAVDILESTPSVRVDADGGISFRGSSGFIVYVNGKPSIFSGTQALEQIPSSQIENIEIITTPSARHDTEGEVGIINIITKKHFDNGLSGVVNVTGSTYATHGLDFLLTQQKGEVRWHLGGTAARRFRKSDFEQEKTTIINDTATTSHSNGPRKGESYSYILRTGWQLAKPKTLYHIDLEGGYEGHKRLGKLNYSEERIFNDVVVQKGQYSSQDDYDLHETLFAGDIGFSHKFNKTGHTFVGSFYLKYGGNALEYFKSGLFNANNEREQGHQAWEAEHRWTVRAKLDYVLPYSSSGRLEAGYQYFSYLEDGDYTMEYWDPVNKEFYWRDDIYNTFYFQRGINSIYGIINQRINSFHFQAGLRGEHTHQVLESSKTWANRTQNRFELFPSAHIGYNFVNNHDVTLAYSRRTTRPELFFMEPYITFRDYYSAEIGNPDIRPEYINSFEINYKKDFADHSLSVSVFHRNRKDKIERLRVPYEAGITLDSMANVGNDYSTGAEVNTMLKFAKWWNMNINGSFFYYKVNNDLEFGGNKQTSTNYEISCNNTFEAAKNTRIQFGANFIGPSVRTQGKEDSFYYFNMAVRQMWLKRKLSSTLAFQNILNTARYNSNINTDRLISHTKIRPKYPLITLTLSYTFNNYSQKSEQQKENHNLFEGTNH